MACVEATSFRYGTNNIALPQEVNSDVHNFFRGGEVAVGPTLGQRIRYLRLALAVPLGKTAREKFGEEVGKLDPTQDKEPYAGSTVKRWEEGAEPSLSAIRAMVALGQKHGLGYVTLTALVDGTGWPQMPELPEDGSGDRRLPKSEIAARTVQSKRAKEQQARRRKAR